MVCITKIADHMTPQKLTVLTCILVTGRWSFIDRGKKNDHEKQKYHWLKRARLIAVRMLATKCESKFLVTNSLVYIRKKWTQQEEGCINCHHVNPICEETNQKWPTGPTNPAPNMLVIATLFQLILNSLLPSCWEEYIPPFSWSQNPVSKHCVAPYSSHLGHDELLH